MRLGDDSYSFAFEPRQTYTPPAQAQASAPAAIPEGDFFGLPYVGPSGASTGLALAPGQTYAPKEATPAIRLDTGRTFLNYIGGRVPAYVGQSSTRGYPGRYSPVSYIGPTVSARPSFNVDFRRKRLRDLFAR